jgi:PAS domain S-box-containing protein
MDFLDCHTFFNYLTKVGEERLYLNACAGIADEEARKIEWLEYGAAVCGCVARDRERIIVEDILNAPDPRSALVTSYGIQAYCCHPLIVQGRLIGTLSFGSRTQLSFSPEQVEVMKTVTDLVASAMHRIKTEEALRESREDLDRAQSVGQIGWWRLDTRRNVLTWSDENYHIFGVRKGTPLTYESFLETLHPVDRQYVDTMWQAALRGEPYDIEHRIVADGQVKWVREKAYMEFDAAGHLQGGFGITQDITGRKQAEEALRESEASLRTAQEALQKANEELECRVRQRTEELLRANRELEKKRYDLNERVKELNCLYRVSHLLREREVILASVLQEVVNVIPSGWQFPEITGAGITLNGLEVRTENFRNTLWKLQRPILIHGAVQGMITVVYCEKPPADAAGPFLSEEDTLIETLAGLIGDFMESLRSRTLLEESEGRYRRVSQQFHALLDAIPDMLVLVSADLRILWANCAAVARSGLTQEDLVGQTYDHLLVGLKAGGKACPAKACFDSGQLTTTRFGTLGSMIWDVHAVPVKDEAGTVGNVILIARDVTSELRLQEEGIRSDRLASLGELAAGVAHEINNPINSIINYAQILANKADTRTKEHAFTEEIVKEGERIAGIVRSLLAFARDARDAKYPTSLRDILSASLVLTTAQLKRDGIDVRIAAPEDLPPVQANQQQIQQVLLNLISNARYALNKKYHGSHPEKILAISGDSRTIDGKAYVHVEVRDRGTGIPKDLLSRVTDPFFTTKPMGEGTGLGLSISNGIVVDHGGRLTVESVEGEYTTVMIDLPVSSAKETS